MREAIGTHADLDISVAPSMLDELSHQQQQRLSEVLDRYLRALEKGRPLDREQLVEQHPDLAEALRVYFDNLTHLHDVVAAFGHPASSSTDSPAAAESETGRLGDFVLLHEVGRGGMGVVYEARQLSLDRRVALKVLPFAAVLETQQITRFKNEAQAAAQLHHPNIVPVFAIGAERGVHYYAMQFINGQPLDRVIAALRAETRHEPAGRRSATSGTSDDRQPADGPSARSTARGPVPALSTKRSGPTEHFRSVIRLGIQAADALHAAHDVGIVHRDIKPSNLMVEAGGKLWVTDFGLARCQTDAALTCSGEVIGTRQYMSPEQASGKAALVDQRTDIYALGATLYELLTLEPAFPTDDGEALRRHADQWEPVRPRRLDPSIPADLETVVLKAMAHERDERYLTAQELADDLRRVLEGKPTVARPPTFWDRGAKFARRHRRAVAVGAVLCLLATIGFGTSALLVNRERAKAEHNFERAERHFREAQDAVDRFGAQLAQRLAEVPGAERVRREVLGETLDYYRHFVDQAGDDPNLQADLALTYSKIGALNDQMGAKADALAAHRKALSLSQRLHEEEPDNAEFTRRLAACHNNLALALRGSGETEEARSEFRRAIDLQEALANAYQDAGHFRADLALSFNNLGLLEGETGNRDAADKAFRRAICLQEEASTTTPDDPHVWRDLAASYNNLASLMREPQPSAAIDLQQRAAELQAKTAKLRPDELQYQSQWALTLNNLGAAQARAGQLAAADASYRQAIEIEKGLLRRAPLERGFRRDLAVSYNNLGLTCVKLGQVENAERSFRNALGLEEQLARENPRDVETTSSLGGMYNNLGIVLEDHGRVDEAAGAYRQAVGYQRAAHEQAATIDRYRDFLSKHYYNLGRALRKLGRADEAARVAMARKQLWKGDPQRLLSVAEELALATKMLAGDNQSELTADGCAELSIAALRDAVAAGLEIPAGLDRNESFAALRGRREFDTLVHP